MEVRRTVPVTLDVDSDDDALLRDTVDDFQKCGYENHADYNAAKNIGLRHLRRNQTGGGEGAPLGVRLNSGTLNVNGDYDSPAEVSARTGVHAESHPFGWVAQCTENVAW